MDSLLELLWVLSAIVSVLSCGVCYCLNVRYVRILETKFPDMIQNLSTRPTWVFAPISWLVRWRKAIKIGDDELTRVAKICCLFMYITAASGIYVMLWVMTREKVL